MELKEKVRSIYNYCSEAMQNIRGERLYLKDSTHISLLCNAVSKMYHEYDEKIKAGDFGYQAGNLSVREKLMSLWKEVANLSRMYDARLEKEMARLRDTDKQLLRKQKVA